MKELVFATNNKHKVEEVQQKLDGEFKIITLSELGCTEDIPEPGDTLEENALIKARYVHNKFKCNCFADDTGLEVEALNGAPGVHTARYAGDEKNNEANMALLLKNLDGQSNRNARFRTVIALIIDNKEYLLEGVVNGSIATEKSGAEGFGYDPIFVPENMGKTFAELPMSVKNNISHRGRAVEKLTQKLKELKA